MIALAWTILLGLYLLIVVWAERRIAGLIQDRPGPNRVGPYGLFQTLADVPKMFLKEDVTPLYVDKLLHTVAPAIILIPALTTIAIVPLGAPITIAGRTIPLVVADVNIGVLYLLALTSVSVYGLIVRRLGLEQQVLAPRRPPRLGADHQLRARRWESRRSRSSSRPGRSGPSPSSSGRAPTSGTASRRRSAASSSSSPRSPRRTGVPFDLPEAESELVAGYHTEYSAFKFGMFFMSEYANMFVASAMIVTLYFGGWTLPFVTFTGNLGALLSLGVFLAKVFAWVFVFIWVRWTLPRFRYDQLMALGWKVLLPLSVVNLLAVAWFVARSRGGRMTGATVVFAFASGLAIVFALLMVVQKTPVKSVLALVVTFFGLAVLSVQLAAPFIAAHPDHRLRRARSSSCSSSSSCC